MSTDDAFAAAVGAMSLARARAFIRNSSSSADKVDEDRETLARRIEMSFTDECSTALRAALASLRASGYVVVPMKPTAEMAAYAEALSDFYLYEEANTVEGRREEMLGALGVGIEHAPRFPPDASP